MGLGGAQTHLRALASRLDRTRFAPAITCLMYEGEMAETVRAADIPLSALGVGRIYGLTAMRALRRFVRRLRHEQPRIVHTYLTSATVFGALAARAAGVPCLITTRRDRGFSDGRALAWALARTNRWARSVVCVSQDVARVVARREGLEPPKLEVIPNGIVLDRFSPRGRRAEVRRELGLPDTAPVVVSVGHITSVKGADVLLEATPRILEEVPEAKVLLVGGGPEAEEAALRRRVQELGLEGCFVFAGHRSDVPDMLEASDVFALSSRSEGQPNALIEAMAMGLACVSTSVGGVPEIVNDGEEALLVPSEDPDALGGACARVLRSPDLRQRLAAAARARVRREHDVTTMVGRYEDLYEGLLGDSE